MMQLYLLGALLKVKLKPSDIALLNPLLFENIDIKVNPKLLILKDRSYYRIKTKKNESINFYTFHRNYCNNLLQ